MMMLTPKKYADRFYGGAVTCATVRNWIKRNKLPVGHVAEKTLTGHYMIRVNVQTKSEMQSILEQMKKSAA